MQVGEAGHDTLAKTRSSRLARLTNPTWLNQNSQKNKLWFTY